MANHPNGASRRGVLGAGLGLGVGAAMPAFFAGAALAAETARRERILVVVELTGGNDGLDTVIPYGDDGYRRVRPSLGLSASEVLKIDDAYGLNPALVGLKTIYDLGLVGVIHGCGYPKPDRSHFSSMDYWHTARPHEAATTGWVGNLADAYWPDAKPNTIVNIASKQALAVQSVKHSPVVFDDPNTFVRAGDSAQAKAYADLIAQRNTGNPTLDYLTEISRQASDASVRVREAIAGYATPVTYGATPLAVDLRKVAALIEGGFPTRIYYVSLGGFDTHAGQRGGRFYLLTGLGEALRAFNQDMKRLGRDGDVAMMMFSEFGRRVEENASAGTDHGTAGPMFVMGAKVRPGLHGTHPSLTDLDENGDLKMTVDFRRVYASVIEEWLGMRSSNAVLSDTFVPLGLFQTA